MDNFQARRETRETRSPSTSPERRFEVPPSRSSGRTRASYSSRYGSRRGDVVLNLLPVGDLPPPPSYEEAVAEGARAQASAQAPAQAAAQAPAQAPAPNPVLEAQTEDRRAVLLRRELQRFFPESSQEDINAYDYERLNSAYYETRRYEISDPRVHLSRPTPRPAPRPAPRHLVTPPSSPPLSRVRSSSPPSTASRIDHLINRLERLTTEEESEVTDQAAARSDSASASPHSFVLITLPFGVGETRIRSERAEYHKERIARFFFSAILSVKEQAPEANAQQLWVAFVEKVKQTILYEDEDQVRAGWQFVFHELPEDRFNNLVNGSLSEVYWKVYSYQLPA